jgi:multidrug efflux pump subunit AcrA (membrane-fusion protein)
MSTQTKRKGPTPEEVIAEQKRQVAKTKADAAAHAAKAKADAAAKALVPARPAPPPVAPAEDVYASVRDYIDLIAPASISGRLIKFSKEGAFVTADDGEPVDADAEFAVLCDETLAGWIRFHEEPDAPPDRVAGLIYDGFVPPQRATLGETDQTKWPIGLSGQPEDPWKHQICIVLQHILTRELFTFATTSLTGRRAVGNLLRHYERMQRTNANEVPIVRLRPGGFNHRDERIGWVATPSFQIVGRMPRDSAAKPDTSVAADMNDSIPV